MRKDPEYLLEQVLSVELFMDILARDLAGDTELQECQLQILSRYSNETNYTLYSRPAN